MLRSGGAARSHAGVGSRAADRAAVADGQGSAVRSRVRAAARDGARSAAASTAGTRSATAGDRAGQLSQPGADRVGAHSPRRGARQRHHPLARTQGADRPRAGAAVHAQRVAIRALGSAGLAPGDGAAVRSVSAGAGGGGESRPGVLRSAAVAHRAPPRRAQHGDRSELGQLHQQADPGPPGRSAGGVERDHETAGDRAARLPGRCHSRRRRAAIRSALPRPDAASGVLPADWRRPVAQADRADHHAAFALQPSRSRAARSWSRR